MENPREATVHKILTELQSLYSKKLSEKPHSTYRVDLFASRLFPVIQCGIHEKRDGFFQKESTLYGNSYYEKE